MGLSEKELEIIQQCISRSWKTVHVPDGKLAYVELADGKLDYMVQDSFYWLVIRYREKYVDRYRKAHCHITLSNHPYIVSAVKHIIRSYTKDLFRTGLMDPNSTLRSLSGSKIFDRHLAKEIYSYVTN